MRKFWTLEAFTELPLCASSLTFCTFFLFLAERKFDWTCLHFALFSPFHFSFHWTSSLCIQPRIKGSVCKAWTWLREKLIGHVYILHFFNGDWTYLHFALFSSFHFSFHWASPLCIQLRIKGSVCKPWTWLREKLAGHVYILHVFLGEKLMGHAYILREKMIGHVYNLQLFSPFNFSFHWTQYLFIQLLIKCT